MTIRLQQVLNDRAVWNAAIACRVAHLHGITGHARPGKASVQAQASLGQTGATQVVQVGQQYARIHPLPGHGRAA